MTYLVNCIVCKLCDVSGHKEHFSSVPEAQEGGQDDVGVPGVGVVGDRGLGPSPLSPAWPQDHFGI